MRYSADGLWGRRTQLGQGGTNKILYSYTGDKLTGILKQPENENTVLHYDAYGRMDRETFANGAYSTYGFDVLDRLTGISHKNAAGTVLGSESYDLYDEVSNLLQKTIDGVVSSYVYDDADQLTSETISGVTTGYSYDANGNRVSRTRTGGPDSYTYDDGDKLTVLNGVALTYDAAGRRLTKGSTTYTWNEDDRLVTVGTGSTMQYNGLGARVKVGTVTSKLDGVDVTDPLLVRGGDSYVPGVSERNGGVTKFVHTDYLGSARLMTDSTGAVTDSWRYDAYGNVKSHTGSSTTKLSFARQWGYQQDSGGLQLLGHRYYESDTGVFLSRDPALDGSNWFGYVRNNPGRRVDPFGLKPGDHYKTADDAAVAALDDVTTKSIHENKEAAGKIYAGTDAQGNPYFSYTEPAWGNGAVSVATEVPEGAQYVGHYHTHGTYYEGAGRFNTDFSEGTYEHNDDISIYHKRQVLGYLGTTDDEYLKYDPNGAEYGKGKRYRYDKKKKKWIPLKKRF